MSSLFVVPCSLFAARPARRRPRTTNHEPRTPNQVAFTLVELILVMAMLVVVLGVASPSLGRFFRGRELDSEAKRFVALTRYGQSRAVSEGLPVILWMDEEQRRYGLRTESSYEDEDPKAVTFDLAGRLAFEVEVPFTAGVADLPWKRTTQLFGRLPTIRFTPDGFIAETSPEYVLFRENEDASIWIGQSRNRLNYEITTNQPLLLRR